MCLRFISSWRKITKKLAFAHQMLRYTTIRLGETNAVNVPMTAHTKICAHVILLFTRHIIKNRYRLGFCILRCHHFFVLAVGVVMDSLHILDNLAQQFVLVLMQGLWPDVNIFEFQIIRFYDERQQSIGLATIWENAENSAQTIRQQCPVFFSCSLGHASLSKFVTGSLTFRASNFMTSRPIRNAFSRFSPQ